MIPISDQAAGIMAAGTFRYTCRVSSWYGDQLLEQDVPVAGGTITDDVTAAVPDVLSLRVPRTDRGVTWAPGSAVDHPLAAWGQQLQVALFVETPNGFEGIGRGWFRTTDTNIDGDSVNVSASGLLDIIAEAGLISPVSAAGNYTTMIRRLIEPGLTVDFTLAPTDRAVASGTVFTDDRLGAVQELLDAWPADAYVDENGVLVVIPPGDTAVSSLALSDGIGGTTMKWGGDISREGAASAVVARGYTAAGADVQATTYDTFPDSPTRYGGPFSPLPVPFIYFSPLLTTVSQCLSASNTVMMRRRRQASRTITTTAVPYLALQTRDGVTVTSEDLGIDAVFGIVDKLTMPLTPSDGAMQLAVRIP